MEPKKPEGLSGNIANKVAPDEDLALKTRKAVCLDYIEGDLESRLAAFKAENPDYVDYEEPDDLYPKGGSPAKGNRA